METQLVLSVGGFPPLSARGCVQELMPIQSGLLRRTINGELLYVGHAGQMKYRSVIECHDKAAMATEGLWRGSIVEVSCVVHLSQKAQNDQVILERDYVQDSLSAMTQNQKKIKILKVERKKISLEQGTHKSEPIYVTYRPRLTMRVVNFSLKTNEWGIKTSWRLEVEEV